MTPAKTQLMRSLLRAKKGRLLTVPEKRVASDLLKAGLVKRELVGKCVTYFATDAARAMNRELFA
jgi:hypothetical protein